MTPPTSGLVHTRRLVAWAFQVHAVLDALHQQDSNSTGFHRLAARKMAENAWDSFQDAATFDDEEVLEFRAEEIEESAVSSERILLAYLKERRKGAHGA